MSKDLDYFLMFLLKLFLVEISFGWFLAVEMPLQILFGSFFDEIWLVKISLQVYLGNMLVSCFCW